MLVFFVGAACLVRVIRGVGHGVVATSATTTIDLDLLSAAGDSESLTAARGVKVAERRDGRRRGVVGAGGE